MNKQPLLVENQRVEYLLEGVVRFFTLNPILTQDLMQEARIELWRLQSQRPGQTVSWYLRGCRFHLQHYLAAGRSLDSTKRQGAQRHAGPTDGDGFEFLDQLRTDNRTFDEASARDLVDTLALGLNLRERAVLDCLADGLSTGQIASRLNLSAPTVGKYRRKIAHLAVKLGVMAPLSGGRWRPRGLKRPASRKPNRLQVVPESKASKGKGGLQEAVGLGLRQTALGWGEPLTNYQQVVDPAA